MFLPFHIILYASVELVPAVLLKAASMQYHSFHPISETNPPLAPPCTFFA